MAHGVGDDGGGRPWPAGGGEMAACVRSFDWAATPLGPADAWPQSLRTAVDLCLGLGFPCYVWWGRERLTQFYNDAALAIVRAKHPAAFAAPARDAWADVWDVAGPLAERVLASGETVVGEDVPMVPDRGGPRETAWFTFSYSPLRDESGAVAGLFVTAIETTERRRAEESLSARGKIESFLLSLGDRLRALADPEALLDEAARSLGERLGADRVGYAEDRGDGETVTVVRNYAADGVPDIRGAYRYADYGRGLLPELSAGRTVLRPDVASDPDLTPAERAAYAALGLGSMADVPLVEGGRLVAVLFCHFRGPHEWSEEEVALLEAVAVRTWAAVGRARADQVLRQSEERFRLLVEGARDYAMFLLDPSSAITFWSAGAERVFGWTEAEALGRTGEFIFTPEDRERGEPGREMETARVTGRAADRRWHLRKDGSRFWADGMLMRLGGGVAGAAGEAQGYAKIARDATEQKRAEDALRAALEEVARANRELEQRVRERTRDLEERTAEIDAMGRMRQELLRQVVEAQEKERARIARDLHDDTGQQVTALRLGLESVAARPALAADPDAREVLEHLQELATDIATKSHQLSFTLRPTALDDLGLMAALHHFAGSWTRWTTGMSVELEGVGVEAGDGDPADRLPPEVETTIYRVVQEALTNVRRHAGPDDARGEDGPGGPRRRVSILVQRRPAEVLTVIEDDGPGFDPDAATAPGANPHRPPLGLFGMQERARLVGGVLEVESAPGAGATITLRIPLPPSPSPSPSPSS